MQFTYQKYIEDNLPQHQEAVYLQPHWTTFQANSVTIPNVPNENRVFIIIHLIQYSVPAAVAGSSSFSDARFAANPFLSITTNAVYSGFIPLNLIIKDNVFVLNCSTGNIAFSLNWQAVTVKSKVQRIDQ